MKTNKEYVLRAGDLLSMGVFSNNGYELIDVLTRENASYSAVKYIIKESGYVQLPMLDSVYVSGLTVSSLEKLLGEKYSYYFVNPFIRIDVTNRNVYVYRGRQGAQIVTLERENMNLLEIIAKAGGLPAGGKAYEIRVIRGDLKNPTVFEIDLSSIEGMRKANLVMEADDVIYIETKLTSADVVYQLSPALSLLSTILVLSITIITLTKP